MKKIKNNKINILVGIFALSIPSAFAMEKTIDAEMKGFPQMSSMAKHIIDIPQDLKRVKKSFEKEIKKTTHTSSLLPTIDYEEYYDDYFISRYYRNFEKQVPLIYYY